MIPNVGWAYIAEVDSSVSVPSELEQCYVSIVAQVLCIVSRLKGLRLKQCFVREWP